MLNRIVYICRGLCGDGTYDLPAPQKVFEPKRMRENELLPYTAEGVARDRAWFRQMRPELTKEGRGPLFAIRNCRVIAEDATFAALEARLKAMGCGAMELYIAKILPTPA